MKRPASVRALASIERLSRRRGDTPAERLLELLSTLERARFDRPAQVLRCHEVLCFLDAFADDRRVRSRARRLLHAFRGRADLRRHRDALAGSGIAGTDTPYRYFWPTARWISACWPGALRLDRRDPAALDELLEALPQIAGRPAAEWLNALPAITLGTLDRLVPGGVTDADWLIGRVARMPGDEFTREAFFDRLDPPFVLVAADDTPERTTERFDRLPPCFAAAGAEGVRPDLRESARRPPARVRKLSRTDAAALVRLARVSMVTRERDLEVFEYPNPADAFLVDDGEGLGFAMLGIARERRATLPATFAGLILRNGVPVGYVQIDALGRHAALSFNLFGTFRGGGTARIFARFAAMTRHVFGCDAFSIEPYQLGHGNDEGIESGAWWFYHRMGFRPADPAARRLAARELARRRRNPGQRSSPATLRRLARSHLFFSLDPRRPARLPRTAQWLAAASARMRPATRLKGTRPTDEWRRRWRGLVLAWTARGRWTARDRRALARLIARKAGRSELDFQRELLRNPRVRRLLRC